MPVYSSAKDDKALAFARAVAGWSWNPQETAEIPLFFRAQTRIEMRCTRQMTRPSIEAIPHAVLNGWLDDNKVKRFEPDVSAAAAVPLLVAELDRRSAAQGESVALLPLLVALADSPVTPHDQSLAWVRRAAAIADVAKAPPLVRTMLAIDLLSGDGPKRDTKHGKAWLARMTSLRAGPVASQDPRSAAYIAILIADAQLPRHAAEIEADLGGIVAERRLEPKDPLRVAALMRIASLRARRGDLDDARSAYLQTGLSAQQCTLADVSPVRLRGAASASDAPPEVVSWHISGWAQTEFDVLADGKTANARTIVAYPPFVYGPALVKVEQRSRYTQSYRPDGGLGCGAFRTSQRFRVL